MAITPTNTPVMSDYTHRLGFIGVGAHARKMRDAMQNAGATVVAHDRSRGSDAESHAWGRRLSWQRQLEAKEIDAVVVAAPPDIALAVAEKAAKTGKKVCVSKPLRWQSSERPPNVWVDLWRLYAPSWLERRRDAYTASKLEIVACGYGPWRTTHSGLEDYGPHALAFALSARPELAAARWDASVKDGYHTLETRGCVVTCGAGREGADAKSQRKEWSIKADGVAIWRDELERTAALENFAEAFLRGDQHHTLDLSCVAMSSIERARR